MRPKHTNQPDTAKPPAAFKKKSRARTGGKASSAKSVQRLQRITVDDLRSSQERIRLNTLQRKIALAPPLDRHPPEKLGDFLPSWFEKNVVQSGELLALASETIQAALPAKLWCNIALGPVQRGLLTIYCSSSTAKMELDMILRAGSSNLRHLQIATKGLIFKVKSVVDRSIVTG